MEDHDPESGEDGKKVTVHLTGGRPWGFTVKEIPKDDTHQNHTFLAVSKVEPEGRASFGGVTHGDVLLSINDTTCWTVESAKQLMLDAENHIELTLWRRENCGTLSPTTTSAGPTEPPALKNINQAATISALQNTATPADGSGYENHLKKTDFSREEELSGTKTIMDLTTELAFPVSSSSQRGSLYSSQPIPYRKDDFIVDLSAHSPRQRDSSAYPVCGLPSSTLYRKSVSTKKTSIVEPVVSRYTRPLPAIPLSEASSYMNINTSRTDDLLSSPGSRSSVYSARSEKSHRGPGSTPTLGPKNQKMMDLLHNHQYVSGSNVFHATPSWSQTECSGMIPVGPMRTEYVDNKKSTQRRSSVPPGFGERMVVPEDVTSLSTSIRGVPVSTTTSQYSQNFRETFNDYGSDGCGAGDGLSSGMTSSRSSLSSVPSSLNLNGPSLIQGSSTISPDRVKSRKNLTNASTSSEELDDSTVFQAKMSDPQKTDRPEVVKMPAIRPQSFLDNHAKGKGPNAHLTTVKEVRTYHIRPSLAMVKERSGSGGGSPPSAHSSPISTPDECRHLRDASIDSSMSWQSNSTNSSGYSSTALSSSTPLLDEDAGADSVTPLAHFRERSKTGPPELLNGYSTPPTPTRSSVSVTDLDDANVQRPLSVSEMVRNFSDSKLLPKTVNPPPKARYSDMPARPTELTFPSPSKPKSAFQQGQRSQLFGRPAQVTFASMEDVRLVNESHTNRRASTAETPTTARNIPIVLDENKEKLWQNSGNSPDSFKSRWLHDNESTNEPKKAAPVKPKPVFRTSVRGVMLGGSPVTPDRQMKATISEAEESGVTEERNRETGEEKYVPKYKKAVSPLDKMDEIKEFPKKTVSSPPTDVDQQISVAPEAAYKSEKRSPTNELELNHAKVLSVHRTNADFSQAFQAYNQTHGSKVTCCDECHHQQELMERLSAKVTLLREESSAIQEEIDANENIGRSIAARLTSKATKADMEKYSTHLREVEEIVSLTMSLTSRISRLDLSLGQLKLPADDLEATTLRAKRTKLESQLEEAFYLQKGIERRRLTLQSTLQNYFTSEEYEDYDQFFTTKVSLLRDRRNLQDKIKMGEEQLICLEHSSVSC